LLCLQAMGFSLSAISPKNIATIGMRPTSGSLETYVRAVDDIWRCE